MKDKQIIKLFDKEKLFDKHDNFREAALHFKEFGRYTNFTPNDHPNSQYYKFWEEEHRRCIEGLNLGWDYISGYNYWYLNYSPIQVVEALGEVTEDGRVEGKRFKDFPAFWDGDYYYYHYLDEAEKRGKHGSVLKTRGRGYSFKGGSMLTRNYFHIPKSISYAMASEKGYLIEDGLLTKAWDIMDFVDEHTPWGKRRHFADRQMHRKASYAETIGGVKIEKGYKSEIIGVSLKDNPDKARGKRGKLILWEEAGKFPGLLKAWQVARPSMEQGKITFGLMIAFGTGGTEGSNFEALEETFYNPAGYNIHDIENIWDKGREGTRCGFFMPVTMNYEGCYDEHGRSNEEKAVTWEEKEREVVKKNASNANAYAQYVAENPMTPQEAVMRTAGSIFPIRDLREHLTEVESNIKKYVDSAWVGKFVLDSETGKVEWKLDPKANPIKTFPLTDTSNIEGAPVLYEMPYRDNSGQIPFGMYIAGCDPYDHDESQTDSLGNIWIMNVLNERIVAEYTGRPATAEEFYEIARRMLMYYNARCNYENNLKGMFTYFKNKNSIHLLSDTPEVLVDRDVMTMNMMNRKKGTPGTVQVNKWARELIKTWLLTPCIDNPDLLNLHKIRSIPLLKELIYWNKDGNFDRVSGLGMLMILKQEVAKIVVEKEKKVKTLSEDPFWNRPFKQNGYNKWNF
jgi:hypothetical protein